MVLVIESDTKRQRMPCDVIPRTGDPVFRIGGETPSIQMRPRLRDHRAT